MIGKGQATYLQTLIDQYSEARADAYWLADQYNGKMVADAEAQEKEAKRKVNGDSTMINDREAFEDAQILAEIAYHKMDSSYWFAAMETLKAAYKGKR